MITTCAELRGPETRSVAGWGTRSGGDRTVIGVVDDVRFGALTELSRPLAYLPLAQRFFPRVFIHARAPANSGVTLRHVRRALTALDPAVPLSDVSTLSERVDEALDRWRAPALIAGFLALVTLVLTMSRLYGVLTLAIGQRTRELAIRVALGAREASVRWEVLVQGMRLVAIGVLVGLAAAGSVDEAPCKPVVRDRPTRRLGRRGDPALVRRRGCCHRRPTRTGPVRTSSRRRSSRR